MGLLPLEEVRRRLQITGVSEAGGCCSCPTATGVALARERGMHFVAADVTVLHTGYELDVDVARLVHYVPGVAAAGRAGLVEAHPYKTEADLFLDGRPEGSA